jgi:Skp family chaperone for outer membrane proteins
MTKGAAAMDRNMAYAGVSVVLAGLLGFTWAQGRGALSADEPKPMTQDIGVVDMIKVYENHKGFQKRSEDFKQASLKAQQKLKLIADAGTRLKQELDLQKPGSAEFARIQKELAEKGTEFQRVQKEQAEQLQKEQTEAISVTYKDIVEEIQRIAEKRGLRLVLRSQGDVTETLNPQKLAESVNRQVLYQNGLDITDEVMQAFN